MKVLCFSKDNCKLGYILGVFHRKGYQPMVDGIHDLAWIKVQFADCAALFFTMDSDFKMSVFDLDDLNDIPSFVCYFSTHDLITDSDLRFVDKYIQHLFYDTEIGEISKEQGLLIMVFNFIKNRGQIILKPIVNLKFYMMKLMLNKIIYLQNDISKIQIFAFFK